MLQYSLWNRHTRSISRFSPIQVARKLDALNQAVNPSVEFENPVDILFGAFSYDFLADGVRWSALWYQGEE